MSIVPSPEQQAVIDHPLEPLRVAAGAGTGKTTTMALRLGRLIADGLVEPESALGITFTNKAAEELADRLRLRLPDLARAGREVEVTTYHGFAHGLLREFGPVVGVERNTGVITPGYARQLMREALGAASHQALDLTMPGSRVDELIALAGRLGDHLRVPDDLRADPGGPGVATARLEMSEVLESYSERKAKLGVVDFSDLIARAHQLVADHPDIAERIRRRYRVVLLDEYQDTNPAQRELLRRIFGQGFPVTAVGDPDQTIYEWRGASLENFAAFPEHFGTPEAPAATLPLSRNRRSSKRVVDLANAVRDHLTGDSNFERLEALDSAATGTVTVARLHNAVDEARWIAREVVRLHDEEGVAWGDIGILFRRHRQIGLIRDALDQHGVPVEVAALGGLLEVPEVTDLHAWLRVLGRPDDAPALLRILLGSRFRLGLGDLVPLANWLRSQRDAAATAEELGGIGWAMLEAVDDLEHCTGLSHETEQRLAQFRVEYRSLLRTAQSVSLVELCRTVLDRTGAWQEVEALPDAARMSARLNLYRFLDLAEEWSPLEGAPSLDAFLDYLELLTEDYATDELDTARVSGEDAVALLTAHRAKGLEWPVVILPALATRIFPSQARRHEDPERFAEFLPAGLRLDAEWWPPLPDDQKERGTELRRRHADQEWRVAYVAVTRAQLHLIATSAHWYSDRQPREASELFDLAAAVAGARRDTWITDHRKPPETLRIESPAADLSDRTFSDGWREALRDAVADATLPRQRAAELGIDASYDAAVDQLRITLEGLPEPTADPAEPGPPRTSVTGLVAYATCPRRYYWSEVDRLPRRSSAARRRGIDLHRRIELHNRGVASLEEADEHFYDLGGGDDLPTDDGGGGFAAFAGSRFGTERPIMVEAPFELRIGDGSRVAGRIDAVYEPEPGIWEVVDFKSGRHRDDPALQTQLEAYALAIQDAGLALDPPTSTRVTFAYLGGDLDAHTTEVDEAWLAAARSHIEQLLDGVAAELFEPQPSDSCRRCDFARFCDAGTAWLEQTTSG